MSFIQPKHIHWSLSQLPITSSEVFRLLKISLFTSLTEKTGTTFLNPFLSQKFGSLWPNSTAFISSPATDSHPDSSSATFYLILALIIFPPLSHKRAQGLSISQRSSRFLPRTNRSHHYLSSSSSIRLFFYEMAPVELNNLLLSLLLEVIIAIFRPIGSEVEDIDGTGSVIFGIEGRGTRWCHISGKGVSWVEDGNNRDEGLMVWCLLADNEVCSAPNGFK